eukprot:gene5662-6537_t
MEEIKKRYPFFIGVHLGAGYHSVKNEKNYKTLIETVLSRTVDEVYERILAMDQEEKEDTKIDAVDIVEMAIVMLEDDPLTNSGRGSNLNLDGEIECDASLMDGRYICRCGNGENDGCGGGCGGGVWAGVGAVNGIRNPIKAASAMLRRSRKSYPKALGRIRPMMLVGIGAKEWAANHGVE